MLCHLLYIHFPAFQEVSSTTTVATASGETANTDSDKVRNISHHTSTTTFGCYLPGLFFSRDHSRLGRDPSEIAGARFFKQAGCLPVTQSPAHINGSTSLSHIKRYTKYFSVKTQAVTTYLYLLSQDLT